MATSLLQTKTHTMHYAKDGPVAEADSDGYVSEMSADYNEWWSSSEGEAGDIGEVSDRGEAEDADRREEGGMLGVAGVLSGATDVYLQLVSTEHTQPAATTVTASAATTTSVSPATTLQEGVALPAYQSPSLAPGKAVININSNRQAQLLSLTPKGTRGIVTYGTRQRAIVLSALRTCPFGGSDMRSPPIPNGTRQAVVVRGGTHSCSVGVLQPGYLGGQRASVCFVDKEGVEAGEATAVEARFLNVISKLMGFLMRLQVEDAVDYNLSCIHLWGPAANVLSSMASDRIGGGAGTASSPPARESGGRAPSPPRPRGGQGHRGFHLQLGHRHAHKPAKVRQLVQDNLADYTRPYITAGCLMPETAAVSRRFNPTRVFVPTMHGQCTHTVAAEVSRQEGVPRKVLSPVAGTDFSLELHSEVPSSTGRGLGAPAAAKVAHLGREESVTLRGLSAPLSLYPGATAMRAGGVALNPAQGALRDLLQLQRLLSSNSLPSDAVRAVQTGVQSALEVAQAAVAADSPVDIGGVQRPPQSGGSDGERLVMNQPSRQPHPTDCRMPNQRIGRKLFDPQRWRKRQRTGVGAVRSDKQMVDGKGAGEEEATEGEEGEEGEEMEDLYRIAAKRQPRTKPGLRQ
ncbi:hypothetical protein VOLCADRAFT_91107 [Volvox carteri f. nagariensis]|uniref:Uncharacterized protein n=1 Tax=Volvox carteri f. nagariensis TaxID=3068 RepID=D8TW71_VOLCA|nr:uncharacterized protein VOLCADRAFT_91107 [Volvox carteri f. nagariensis]EFJ48424.1 hypothetical protein VOLCADRAFT_91107 [Volvox carteri f. nagariensis]|eukprot:XP_002950678.1 hypothetical protein VOLCADRAFT_91107 [Volvox carteri f. nagariensis]